MSQSLTSVESIKTMSYTDFVGLVKQWNVPPGSYSTLSRWRVFGNITSKSTIFEAATTTGFSLRELALMTGCSGVGVDISKKSIETAIELKQDYAPKTQVEYVAHDALTFAPGRKFSHVIVGAALRFFPDAPAAVRKLTDFLNDDGLLLSTEFYCRKPIPSALVDEARRVFDITVTQDSYKKVMAPYRSLTLVYESRQIPHQETKEELEYYCHSTIERFVQNNPDTPQEVLKAMYDRLMTIKDMSNRLREYQGYNVLVHKKDNRYYPHRYTELF